MPERGGISARLVAALDAVLAWQERARSRRQLRQLDARMLRDIGLSAADVERHCANPFRHR